MSDSLFIKIIPNNFEYDIYTLVKAFYPDKDIKVLKEDDTIEPQTDLLKVEFTDSRLLVVFTCGNNDIENENSSDKCSLKTEAEIDYDNRSETKNVLKRTLYSTLKKTTGNELPWGTLTGIRPVRIALNGLEEGKTWDEMAQYYRDTYYVSEDKIKLSLDVATLERKVLSKINYKGGYSLYVGIPFCPTICLYCSFTSFTAEKWDSKLDEYLDAVETELEYVAANMGNRPDSIYIGGGTPTVLSPARMKRLTDTIARLFDMENVKEFTVEAGRPDTIDREKLQVIKAAGVTRISINPQTMNQKTLDLIGRKHTVEDIVDRFNMARELGFDNINMDLIIGLPGETKEDVRHTLERVIELNPENITCHSLAVKRAARLNLFKKQYEEMGILNNEEIMNMTTELITKAGLNPYYLYRQKNMAGNLENVGYAKPGYEGLYNILIMEEVQTIVACGAGTVTKRVEWSLGDGVTGSNCRIERCDNVKDVKMYMENIQEMIDRKRELFK